MLSSGHLVLLLETVHQWRLGLALSLARAGCSLQRVIAEAADLHHTAICQIINLKLLLCLVQQTDVDSADSAPFGRMTKQGFTSGRGASSFVLEGQLEGKCEIGIALSGAPRL